MATRTSDALSLYNPQWRASVAEFYGVNSVLDTTPTPHKIPAELQ